MNKWKALAIIFTLLTFGAVQETLRILKSPDPDISSNRSELTPMAIILTGLSLIAAIFFWIKSNNQSAKK